jgi:tetratricopeptide (TPR) repeat protein
VNQRRDVTVSGVCSVHDLKQHLLTRTKDAALDKIMSRAEQTARHATWVMYEGSKALAAKEYDRAIADFSTALRLDPKDAHAFRERGDAWGFKEEYDKAIQDYDQAIRLNTEDPLASDRGWPAIVEGTLAFNNRGWAWYEKKEYDKAIKDYDEATRIAAPDHDLDFRIRRCYALAFFNRGLAYREKQEYGKAKKDYDEAYRLDSERTKKRLLDQGDEFYEQKEYDKAIKEYDEAIRLDPKYALAFCNRGRAWDVKREHDKAIKDYGEAIGLDPKDGYAFHCRSWAWNAKKEYDKAIKDCDEVIRLNPKDAGAHYSRSVAQLLDRRVKAIDGFQAVLELQNWKGEKSPYAVILGHLAARQAGNEPAAKRFLTDSAGKLNETWPFPVIQFLRGDIDETALLKLSTDNDKRTEACCFLGMDHAIKRRKNEALAHFAWVKEHGNQANIEYTIALAELARLEQSAEQPKR